MDLSRDKENRPLLSDEKREAIGKRFADLACVMERLRRDCPWDSQQTPDSLKRGILEEAYEVLEAIEDQNWDGLREELGDHLLQVLFQACIQNEENRYDIEDVLREITEKMVRRHPHVFGDASVDDAQAVNATWDQIKEAEKGPRKSLFDHFPKGLPALLESFKIGKKAAKVGFDWPEPLRVLDKVEEEIHEIRDALKTGDQDHVREELGDLLFAVSNLVRKFDCEPEETLRAANHKFMRRFRAMERLAREDGVDFSALDLDTQETYWNRAKKDTQKSQTSPNP